MTDKTGGPAFPQVYHPDMCCDPAYVPAGMSLRDYMATKFAAAWTVALATRHGGPGLWGDEATSLEANRLGLKQADAMLQEREK